MSSWADTRRTAWNLAACTGKGVLFGAAAVGLIVAGALLQIASGWVVG